MTDETNNPDASDEAPEFEDMATEDFADNPAEDDQEEISDEEDAADDIGEDDEAPTLYSVKVNGKEQQVSLEQLQAGYMQQADYTVKTQDLAEQRKGVEQRIARLDNMASMSDLERQAEANLLSLSKQINEIQQADLEQLAQEDPVGDQQLSFRLQGLNQKRDQLTGALQQHRQQMQLQVDEETRIAMEQGRATLAKEIEGYSPDLESKLADFGNEFGFSRDEVLDAVADPRSIKVLHLAYLGQKALAQQQKRNKHARNGKTRPAKTLRGSGGKFKAGADTDDFAAFERMANASLADN